MLRKQVLSVILTCLFALSLFVGCGSSDTLPSAQKPAAASQSGAESTGSEVSDLSQLTGKVVEWNWNQMMIEHMTEIFAELMPNVEYEPVLVASGDYMQKLQSSLAAGTDVPDVILAETAFRGKLFSMDILENLEAAPYNVDRTRIIDNVVPLLCNPEGELVAFDQQFCPAGFAYRRDLMQKYFGVEEPEDVEKLVTDWDAFIATGLELKEKSGGKVNMMAGMSDLIQCLNGQNTQEYINLDTMEIDITKRYSAALAEAVRVRDAGVPLGQYESGTPAWNATYSEGNVAFYNVSTWGAKTYIAGNDPDGKGRWGLVKSPGSNGFTQGGTAVGVYSGSENKEAAFAWINYMYNSNEGAGEMYKRMGYIYSFKDFYDADDAPINNPGFYDDYFKGQHIGKYFYDVIAPTIKTEPPSEYQSIINESLTMLYPLYLQNNTMTDKDGLEFLITEVQMRAKNAAVK